MELLSTTLWDRIFNVLFFEPKCRILGLTRNACSVGHGGAVDTSANIGSADNGRGEAPRRS